MKRIIYFFDQRLNLVTLLLLFWSIFWTLDGLDKFFDGQTEILHEKWASKGTVVDMNGNVAFTIQPLNTVGWFGVNYSDQVASYFKTVHLPRSSAMTLLYAFAAAEVLTGLLFLILFVWQLMPGRAQDSGGLLADRTVHRIAYKLSVILFLVLSVAFQIFGDRTRLWEIGTYLLMTLVAYDLWYRTDRFLLASRRARSGGAEGGDDGNSDQASAYGIGESRRAT